MIVQVLQKESRTYSTIIKIRNLYRLNVPGVAKNSPHKTVKSSTVVMNADITPDLTRYAETKENFTANMIPGK